MKDEKMVIRPPLAPIADDPKCKEQYEKLHAEFVELEALKVKDVDGFIHDEDVVVTLEDFNSRVAAYTQRREAYNAEFVGLIETRDHVRANIKEIHRKMDENRAKEEPIQKWFDEKWGDEYPLPMPENANLMLENPEEWERQCEECERKFEEWDADHKKVFACQTEFTDLFELLYAEERKFEDIQKAADAAFEDMAKRTLADGTLMTDEQLAEYNKTHPENV